MSVVDLFKGQGEVRAKKELGSDYFYNNRSVYAQNFVKSTYVNTVNDFTGLVGDEDILSIRLVDEKSKEVHDFNRTINNRMQRFTYKNKPIDYSEVTGVEQISGEGLYNLKQQGYNNFYNLYKKNEFGNAQVLCVLAIKK